jgi:hypothetical protein
MFVGYHIMAKIPIRLYNISSYIGIAIPNITTKEECGLTITAVQKSKLFSSNTRFLHII